MTSYDDLDWNELPKEIMQAAETLGYTEEKWDNDKDTDITELDWEELTNEQRKAAEKIGLNEQTWDEEDSNDKTDKNEAEEESVKTETAESKSTSKGTTSNQWTHEDLIDLIRAVKFSNKDASMRVVHNEITTQMSTNPSFEFLQDVKLNDVKKVWKKAISGGAPSSSSSSEMKVSGDDDKNDTKMNSNENTNANANADILPNDGKILKFYTVGDGSVKTLAEEYTLKAAALVSKQNEEELKNYVHCFLDVPADKSGTRPHQALINFNSSKPKKSGSGAGKSADGKGIVKIQMAAPIPGMTEKTPMLLYNADRSARTFIHPSTEKHPSSTGDDGDDVEDEDEDEDGYDKIRNLIIKEGVSGALSGGGTKAYFHCHITRRNGDAEKDIVSVDVTSGLAPAQKW